MLNCDQYDKAILEEYKKCSKLRWMVRNLFSVIKEHDQERAEAKYLMQTLKKINSAKNYYSVVFCINGSFLSDKFYQVVKERNPQARFIYYAWDDVKNLIKQSHIKFFNEKFAYNISLSDIADQAKVSKSTALNLFQRYLGISPVTYLINYRLQEAAKLLASTEKKVTVISKDTGFDNVDYFCKAFKKYYKLTPTEYRKKAQ